MKLIRIMSTMIFATLLLSASFAAAGTPATLSYQGSLYDNNNLPITAVKNMTFKLYKSTEGASPISGATNPNAFWTEDLTSVNVTNGRFAVILGNTATLNPDDFNADVWLGVKVGSDSEMTPRQKMTSVAFALNADNGVPVGGIIMWSGTIANIPTGWKLCDGQNGTPNLLGRFVLAADSDTQGRLKIGNKNAGYTTHTLTLAEMPPHNHDVPGYKMLKFDGVGIYNGGVVNGEAGKYPNLGEFGSIIPASVGGGAEFDIMPPYYVLAYIMRVK